MLQYLTDRSNKGKPMANESEEVVFLLPDISGFTKFLNSTEAKHSRHIIEELMNLLIKETSDVFTLAEVEGDALFLYKKANKVDVVKIEQLAKKAFIAFHQHLANYNHFRICDCGACSSAVELSLKFVVHHGKVEFLRVNNKEKPYGLEVIKAHRLLKNSIQSKEYILYSEDFRNHHADISNLEGPLLDGTTNYDEIGELKYHYEELTRLKEDLKVTTPTEEPGNQKLKTIVKHDISIDAPLSIVYEVLSDFKYRPYWNPEAQVVDYDEKDIYRVGTEHYCVINNKKFKIKTIADKHSRLEFGEQVTNNGIFKEFNLYFIFNEEDHKKDKTSLTIEIRIEVAKIFTPLLKWFVKPKMDKKIPEMMDKIKSISEETYKERTLEEQNLARQA